MTQTKLLYHYCSNAAFWHIITQRRVRLSLLSMSNDAKEGRHILDIAGRLIPGDFAHKGEALEKLEGLMSRLSALGFCLSGKGDLLSQWRGYADDAKGVSIGFDRAELDALAAAESSDDFVIGLGPVAYDEKFLAHVISPEIAKIVEHYKSGRMMLPRLPGILTPMTDEEIAADERRYREAVGTLIWMLLDVAKFAYRVKSSFFEEEDEYRLLLPLSSDEDGIVLPEPNFHPTSDSLRPYREFPAKGFPPSTVKKLILGPKSKTPVDVARLFLKANGFEHVEVGLSVGSYR